MLAVQTADAIVRAESEGCAREVIGRAADDVAHGVAAEQVPAEEGRIRGEHQRPDPDAERRLQVLEHHTELGSGYRVALKDLELRGGPNPDMAVADGAGGVSFQSVEAIGTPATVTFTPLGDVGLDATWGTPYARDLAWMPSGSNRSSTRSGAHGWCWISAAANVAIHIG